MNELILEWTSWFKYNQRKEIHEEISDSIGKKEEKSNKCEEDESGTEDKNLC